MLTDTRLSKSASKGKGNPSKIPWSKRPLSRPLSRPLGRKLFILPRTKRENCRCAGILLLRTLSPMESSEAGMSTDPMVLLVQSKRKTYQYSFPKGKKNGNEDTLSAAKREMWEETGLKDSDYVLLPDKYYFEVLQKTGEPHIMYYVGYLTNPDAKIEPIDKREILSADWFRIEQVEKMHKAFYVSRKRILKRAIFEHHFRERMKA